MTKEDLLKGFERLGVEPPNGASKAELERTYQETIRNIRSVSGHPLADRLTKEDRTAADAMIEEAASHDQENVNVGGEG